ncbi:MAG: diaminopimelate epimerase, partial [Clostridia bacterium]|nr:diaminopimelate epimerase [Clostridia bacterium]
RNDLRLRVWERGNGETLACGTGAAAATVAAIVNEYCDKGKDITVRLAGGKLTVNYDGENVILTGETTEVFKGEFEY